MKLRVYKHEMRQLNSQCFSVCLIRFVSLHSQNNFEKIRHSNHQTSIVNYFISLNDLTCFKIYEVDDQNIFEQVESRAFERFTIDHFINMIDIVCFENEIRLKFRMKIDEHVSKQFAFNQILLEKQINAFNFITCDD